MKNNNGFTLVELVVVIAILGILAGIAIPRFMDSLEASRQATDIANAREAISLANIRYVMDNPGTEMKYYFDAAHGRVLTESEVVGNISPYGESSIPITTLLDDPDNIYTRNKLDFIKGTPNGNFVIVTVTDTGMQVAWDKGTLAAWHALGDSTKIAGDSWWNNDGYYENANNENWKSGSAYTAYQSVINLANEDRVAADQEILNSLASYFEGMSLSEAKRILGDQYDSISATSDRVLFTYKIDNNTWAVNITPDVATASTEYFEAIGYTPSFQVGVESSARPIGSLLQIGSDGSHVANNHVDSYLFTSDQVVGSQGVERQIKISFKKDTTENKITGVKIKINGTDLSSN